MGSGSGNPRYSNRRGERSGTVDDNEEDFHRGSSYSNSNKFQGGRGGMSRGGHTNSGNNYSQLHKGKGDIRRTGPKDDHASSIDRGKRNFF